MPSRVQRLPVLPLPECSRTLPLPCSHWLQLLHHRMVVSQFRLRLIFLLIPIRASASLLLLQRELINVRTRAHAVQTAREIR